jgi:uncharacterized protein YceK
MFGGATADIESDCNYTIPCVYSGVANDFRFVRHGTRRLAAASVIDLPFSFAADTVLLPYTIVRQVTNGDLVDKVAVVMPDNGRDGK